MKGQNGDTLYLSFKCNIPDTLKNGIYFNFQEFISNNPSIRTDSILLTKKQLQYWGSSANDKNLKIASSGQNVYCNLNKECWGYSINGHIFLSYNKGFYPINFLGRLSTFEVDYGGKLMISNYGPTGFSKSDFKEYIIDLKTGKIYELSINFLELQLKAKSISLYNQYMKEPDKGIVTDIYLKKVNKFY